MFLTKTLPKEICRMNYKHLNISERACIANWRNCGLSISRMASLLGRDKSTISRELKRNADVLGYNPANAQTSYALNKKNCGCKPKFTKDSDVYARVVSKLLEDWSPEQIVNTVAKDISLATVYRAFHRKLLSPYAENFRRLTHQKGWRKGHERGDIYKGCRPIGERKKSILARKVFGHWELDCLEFSRNEPKVLAVFVERKSRYVITVLMPNKQKETMKAAIKGVFAELPYEYRRTMTVDRGLEFLKWREIEAELLGTKIYFCDPQTPRQKGTVENTNGLLRQYYPKGRGKKTLAPTVAENAVVQARLNNRPRKKLNYATPYQKIPIGFKKALHLI